MVVYFRSVFKFTYAYSRQNIATIDENIATSHVSGSITGKVKVETLDLLGVALTSQGSHAVSLVDGKWASTHLGVKEAGRNNVHAGKLAPFASKRLSKVSNIRLGCVVYWLVCWHIDNVGTHAGCDDEVSEALTVEYLADILGTEDNSIN